MSQQLVKETILHTVAARLTALSVDAKVSWPNKKFTPPDDRWFAVYYFPSQPTTATLGDAGEEELTGLVQVDVNVKSNSGEKMQNAALTALESWFIAGRVMSYQGQDVTVTGCSRSPGRIAEASWKISLSIYFRASYYKPTLIES